MTPVIRAINLLRRRIAALEKAAGVTPPPARPIRSIGREVADLRRRLDAMQGKR